MKHSRLVRTWRGNHRFNKKPLIRLIMMEAQWYKINWYSYVKYNG